jgi:adenine deaminase
MEGEGGIPVDLEEALDRLPKVELHCHVEGTMRPRTVAELAAKNRRKLPVDDPVDLYRYGNLNEFLAIFWLVQECLGDRDDWARLANESTFFTPARHLAMGQRLEDIVAGLQEGLSSAEQETGARVMLIADIDRAYGGDAGRQMVEELVELRRAGKAERVIGLGMDSTELGVDPAQFLPAYKLAGSAGLRLTAHQGENSPPSAILFDVEELGAERIDHGISILDDAEVARTLADRGIPLTVCPISNVKIANLFPSLAEHPWAVMREAGLHLTLNTDDPAMIDDDLGKEYAALAAARGYGFAEMVEVSLSGVDAMWLDDEERRRLRRGIQTEAEGLQEELRTPS